MRPCSVLNMILPLIFLLHLSVSFFCSISYYIYLFYFILFLCVFITILSVKVYFLDEFEMDKINVYTLLLLLICFQFQFYKWNTHFVYINDLKMVYLSIFGGGYLILRLIVALVVF